MARKKVSDFMCHDVRTADKFYARNPDLKVTREIRELIADSIREEAGPSGSGGPGKKAAGKKKKAAQEEEGSSTSSEDIQVPYQESGVSSSSEEEEEGRKTPKKTRWS